MCREITKKERKLFSLNKRRFLVIAISTVLFAFVFFCLGGKYKVRFLLERIYTPPALTIKNIPVYKRFVNFVKSHPNHRKVRLTYHGDIIIKKNESATERESLSSNTAHEIHEISNSMRKISCVLALRSGSYVVFIPYPATNIWPRRPGVLYSLDGSNPNNVFNEFLKDKKPFKLINGSWYMSRRLDANAYLRFPKRPLPNSSLIDHSLRYPDSLSGENKE